LKQESPAYHRAFLLLDAVPGLLLRELWITADQRPERHTEQGLNAIVAGG